MDILQAYNGLCSRIPSEIIRLNESMKRHTSFRIGGPADIMVIPSDIEHIRRTLQFSTEFKIPVFVMGNGSNLLVRDKGIRGIVIKIADNFSDVHINGLEVRAESGVLLSVLSRMTIRENLAGLEFASGIPGTLGGAVAMNAGAYGGEMKDVVKSVLVMDYRANTRLISGDELEFGYRSSCIQKDSLIALKVLMSLKPGKYEESKAIVEELARRRREKQPLSYPSAGSTFKRPVGYFAGKLIQDAGLKGMRVGDAQISELHAGFIINLGNATARDVIELIETARARIHKQFGVEISPEVRIVGEE